VFRKDLDGNFAVEPRISRSIYLSYPASAERPNHVVRAEPLAGYERHGGP
jgi:hypothetical protein